MPYHWPFWARQAQLTPSGSWFIWMILAGRGWGKTRTAVEAIASMVRGETPLMAPPGAPSHMTLVADTPFDMRQYSIEGPSGFLNVGLPDFRPRYEPSKRTLEWPNGCRALLFSAEDPETLRGASGSFFWWDELAKGRYSQAGWDNMMFGMREGNPRGIVTTTPRPIPLLRELIRRKSTHVTRGTTWDNKANLSKVFFEEVIRPKMGTRLGRQEINAEILEDVPGALWTRDMFDAARLMSDVKLPDMQRIVVAIDPSGTKGDEDKANDVGIVVAGLGKDGLGYVLADLTCHMSPQGWGRVAVDAYYRFQADTVLAETNYGGAMVGFVIRAIDADVPFKEVVASRGKVVRAEPVSALYEQNRVRHVHGLDLLEDQMCAMTFNGYRGDGSPDRVDGVVWALTDLMLKKTHSKFAWSVGGQSYSE